MDSATTNAWQILWGVNTLILGIVTFFIKIYRDDQKEQRAEVNAKLEALTREVEKRPQIITCDKLHKTLEEECEKTHKNWEQSCDRVHADILRACERNHDNVLRMSHIHGNFGQAGEVVK